MLSEHGMLAYLYSSSLVIVVGIMNLMLQAHGYRVLPGILAKIDLEEFQSEVTGWHTLYATSVAFFVEVRESFPLEGDSQYMFL